MDKIKIKTDEPREVEMEATNVVSAIRVGEVEVERIQVNEVKVGDLLILERGRYRVLSVEVV